MKIAALADIHGNYQALIAVIDHVERWKPDLVFVLGDIINRGPCSRDCLHLIQQKIEPDSWQAITGNHEQYVLRFDSPDAPRDGNQFELSKIIHWTYQSLSPVDIQSVKELPLEIETQLPGNQIVKAVHASMGGIRIGIYPDSSQKEILDLIQPEVDLFLVGHTHQPLVRTIGKTTVINAGSIHLTVIPGLDMPRSHERVTSGQGKSFAWNMTRKLHVRTFTAHNLFRKVAH
jgi:putative phosphoesterase